MLPSGNDAGFALAQFFGKFLSYTFANEKYHLTGEEEGNGITKFVEQK